MIKIILIALTILLFSCDDRDDSLFSQYFFPCIDQDEDGLCDYDDDYIGDCDGDEEKVVSVNLDGGSWQDEITWFLTNQNDDTYDALVTSGGAPHFEYICLENGTYILRGCDSYGDSWNGNTITFYLGDELLFSWDGPSYSLDAGDCESVWLTIDFTDIVN